GGWFDDGGGHGGAPSNGHQMYFAFVRSRVATQPAMGGIQNVMRRWVKVAAMASVAGMPAAVRPAMSPASTTPIPPGTGVRLAMVDALQLTTTRVARGSPAPKACKDAPRHRANNTLPSRLDAMIVRKRRGEVRSAFMVSRAWRRWG